MTTEGAWLAFLFEHVFEDVDGKRSESVKSLADLCDQGLWPATMCEAVLFAIPRHDSASLPVPLDPFALLGLTRITELGELRK
jgi:hypothetical protein